MANYGRHLTGAVAARQEFRGDEALEFAICGLVPTRLGSALLFLSDRAEEGVVELERFLALSAQLADDAIGSAADPDEMLDATLGALDRLHAFLIANDFVTDAYIHAATAGWMDKLAALMHAGPTDGGGQPPQPQAPQPGSRARTNSELALAA
jgi:hypothetical protein